MIQKINQIHNLDDLGNPAGGTSTSIGLVVHWQNGPIPRDSKGNPIIEENGCFVETVILACIGRLDFYQSSRFACKANTDALSNLHRALSILQERTADRVKRGVEGKHEE